MIKHESLTDQIAALASGAQTPLSLAEQSLTRAKRLVDLNAFVAIDEDIVIAQAKAATLRREEQRPLSPIDGVPIAVKDNFLTQDYPTTACSDAGPLEPSGKDATVIANLRAAGAVIFGKTNMHEWAYGATNTTSNIGPTRNPHNRNHITGGSSGGSAAAVAGGIVSTALGSDTGGSVRIPASACGLYGFKPSYGRASRHGILPLSWSLDAPGPMATTLSDIAHVLPYLVGADTNDTTTTHAEGFGRIPERDSPPLINLNGRGLERSAEVNSALEDALARSGARISQGSIPQVGTYFSAWEAILHCEASSYHQPLLERHPEGFSPITRAHLEAGTKITAVEMLAAQKLRSQFLHHLTHELHDWDALVLPTLPVPAPAHGQDWQTFGGRTVTTQDSMTWFCWLGNLAGLPCLTLPIGVSATGLPIGMMLMGRPGGDEALLAVAKTLDAAINGVR